MKHLRTRCTVARACTSLIDCNECVPRKMEKGLTQDEGVFICAFKCPLET